MPLYRASSTSPVGTSARSDGGRAGRAATSPPASLRERLLGLGAAAGNKAVTGLVRRNAAVQREAEGAAPADVMDKKLSALPVETSFRLPATVLECGIRVEPKIVLKGQAAVRVEPGGDGALSGGMGPVRLRGAKGDSFSLFKAEAQKKLGSAGAKAKGSLDLSPAGLTPSVEFSAPLGVAGADLRVEFAPWKFKHDFEGNSSIKILPLTAGAKWDGEFLTESFAFKGSVGVDVEASVEPLKAVRYLTERYATMVESEAVALAATEVALVAMAVGGALLIGLDSIDEERRRTLLAVVTGRARTIVRAESTYLTALEGRRVAPANPYDERALAEAGRTRAALAAKAGMDVDTLAAVAENRERTFAPFSWRDHELDELERAAHTGLDAWAKAHPVRSLWGLRIVEDKRNVTDRIEAVRAGG